MTFPFWMYSFVTQKVLSGLFANGEDGDEWLMEKPYLFTKSSGGVINSVTTTGDLVFRALGLHNGINADQDDSNKRPVYQEGGGLSWIELDGVDDSLEHTFGTGGDLTLAAGAERLGGSNRQQIIGAGGPGDRLTSLIWGETDDSPNWGTFANSEVSTDDSILNTPSVLINEGTASPVTQTLYTNGALAREYTDSFAGSPPDRRNIGKEKGSSHHFNGRIFGCLALGRTLSGQERSKINQYLANKTGVTL